MARVFNALVSNPLNLMILTPQQLSWEARGDENQSLAASHFSIFAKVKILAGNFTF